ncbi:S8 family peptidase [Numidum massiliense]|uniref:S8 family peptidase n=1 Tax=Numidum massiliense TaxID=1522315 RepID=UPI0006D5A936|nr:S8 family peptidase [Numidum massiliense]
MRYNLSNKQLVHIVADPHIAAFECDRPVSLPSPKIKTVLSYGLLKTKKKAHGQWTTWNIARVLGGRMRPNKGERIRIGVIDTGIDLNHPDLRVNIKGGINLLYPSKPPQDDNGHGTHVAGIIGAYNHPVGVAPAVSLYAIKVLNERGTGTLATLIKGIEWAIRNRMDIINISVSGGKVVPPILSRTIAAAVNRGMIVVAAAGNSGTVSGRGDTVVIPGRLPTVIAVAALDYKNARAPFSATGPAVDLAAPGVNILSTYTGSRYAILSGTSMAAPHVTGAAAILKRTYPTASVALVKKVLQARAIDLLPRCKDPWTGSGLVQVR